MTAIRIRHMKPNLITDVIPIRSCMRTPTPIPNDITMYNYTIIDPLTPVKYRRTRVCPHLLIFA